MKSLRKQARIAPKFVLVTSQYGFDIYIADEDKVASPITNTVEEALEFSVGFDNEQMKLKYYKALTGYDLLKIRYL